ncbi:MAG: hypothetical protein LBJ73_03775 [Rickettsiales bacterium]|jgi:hypothetical protein|nr:hypothetical protein [Rickettsiales bacterium]
MAKSAGVLHTRTEIEDNILIQESIYLYVDDFDAERKQEKSGTPKKGWTWVGTSHDYKKTANGGLWIVREIFVKADKLARVPKK